MRSVPVILKSYLVENAYSYIEKISKLKDFNKKSNYFTADENRVLYAATDKTCTFVPDAGNSGKYQHSQKTMWGWDLSGNTVNRNMDLFYRAYLDLSAIGKKIKNNFLTVDIDNGVYTIKVYEIGGKKNGKLTITVNESCIDYASISQIEAKIMQWKQRFDTVEQEPVQSGNYDHWIELWNNDYKTAFGSSFVQGAVTFDKNGGQRPRKIWSEVITVPTLNWKVTNFEI